MSDYPTPNFETDPMLEPLITKLRGSDELLNQAVGMIIEQQSKTSKEVSYQTTEIRDIKRDVAESKIVAHTNGERIASLERLNLAAVVKENAANTLWRSSREQNWKRFAAVAGFVATVAVIPALVEAARALARHFIP